MSDLFFADMVRETCVDVGAGALALAGAVPGFRRFADAVPPGAAFPYAIRGVARPGEWEIGSGTIDAAGRLAREAVAASSAGGAAVDFSTGLKTASLSVGADWYAAIEAAEPAAGGDAPATIASVDGLSEALAGKQAAGDYAEAAHGHDLAGIDGLSDALAGKQPAGSYAAAVHGHASSAITGLGSAALRSTGTSGSTVPLCNGAVTWSAPHNFAAMPYSDVGFGLFSGSPSQYCITREGTQVEIRSAGGIGLVAGGAIGLYVNSNGIYPGSDGGLSMGLASLRWSTVYAASGTISTSDEREKKYVGAIPKAWLDAWGDVGWRRYKFRAANGASSGRRWHVGLIAQRVHAAFAARGIDAFAIGLLCRDDLDGAQASGGDRWGLRYDECFALEAAWQRRAVARITARIERIEAALGTADKGAR